MPPSALRSAAIGTGVLLSMGLAVPAAHADEPEAAGAICTSAARPEVAAALDEAIHAITVDRASDIAVGVSAFGGDLTCGFQADKGYDAASVGKVLVLTTLLRTAQEEGRELTAEEDELATAMITVSDNDATVELRNLLGKERMQEFLDLAGMSNTTLHENNAIGLMKINANDELRLLDLITTENDILGDEQRAYAQELMGSVIEEQQWGTPTGAPEGTDVLVKNGWLPYDDTDIWRINSVGAFDGTEAGPYQIVVLTDDNDGMAYGVESIELVATEVHAALNGSDAPAVGLFSERDDLPQTSDGSDRA
ncbi:serine hydrolase [Nocardiopsis mangrovi]|uniref:Serine hydrolase n=1 Tax=Nocardiopsis mangrovi TaxID=1179818 RepID=A0ABV9E3I0_9ACTN